MLTCDLFVTANLLVLWTNGNKDGIITVSNLILTTLYLNFNGHFPDEPGLAGVY